MRLQRWLLNFIDSEDEHILEYIVVFLENESLIFGLYTPSFYSKYYFITKN